jgi:hypothetical protein
MLESNRSEIDSLRRSSIRWSSCSTARRPSCSATTSASPPLQGLSVGGASSHRPRRRCRGCRGPRHRRCRGIGAGHERKWRARSIRWIQRRRRPSPGCASLVGALRHAPASRRGRVPAPATDRMSHADATGRGSPRAACSARVAGEDGEKTNGKKRGRENSMTEGSRMTGESRSLRIGVVAGVEHKIGASES